MILVYRQDLDSFTETSWEKVNYGVSSKVDKLAAIIFFDTHPWNEFLPTNKNVWNMLANSGTCLHQGSI